MYDAWIHYGEFQALGVWGILLALVRRVLFGELCRDAALGSGGKGRMLKAMTLKFNKSGEVKVGIHDIPVFVQKYLCQETKFGISLGRWRRLPERWTGMILGLGFLEAVALWHLNYNWTFAMNRFLSAATAAVLVALAALLLESDSLWEQTQILLLDYVSNTLYPRQFHVYEGFAEEETVLNPESKKKEDVSVDKPEGTKTEAVSPPEEKKPKRGLVLDKEEEEIFQEVLSDFLGSSV